MEEGWNGWLKGGGEGLCRIWWLKCCQRREPKRFKVHWSLLDRFYLLVSDSLFAFIAALACYCV